MEQKFLIKTTALKLMEELYLKSDSSLRATKILSLKQVSI